jgi:protocatechuate 3,4-dioxygenase alpha subunit
MTDAPPSSNRLAATLEDTVGPYFPPSFVDGFRHDLSRHPGMVVRPAGEVVRLTGTIRDVAGVPVAPVLVEYWQADAAGRYRTPIDAGDPALDPWFDGYGRQYCEDGRYSLTTVRPGAAAGDGGRAPHVTLTIFCDGLAKLVTQIFFADEPGNGDDPLLASLPPELATRLIATREGEEDGIAVYRRDIVLRGAGETPFFDDIES